MAGETLISQRELYEKSILTGLYRDYEDGKVLSQIGNERVILDLGCGEGITLERMVRRFPDKAILGIDLSPANAAICQNRGLPVCLGDSYRLGLRDGSIDCCLFMEVIEHLDHARKALLEISRALRNGGLLLLLVPNDAAFMVAHLLTLKFREARYDPGHVKRWSPKLIREELQSCGFQVDRQVSLPFRLWHLSLHHLVVARKR